MCVGVMCDSLLFGLVIVLTSSSTLLYGKESATPDSKENKHANKGSRLFSKAFSVRRVVV